MFDWFKNIFSKKKFCDKCEVVYYICPRCKCQHSTQHAAKLCEDWCKILGSEHDHNYYHNHEG